jgi:hypothetical protein
MAARISINVACMVLSSLSFLATVMPFARTPVIYSLCFGSAFLFTALSSLTSSLVFGMPPSKAKSRAGTRLASTSGTNEVTSSKGPQRTIAITGTASGALFRHTPIATLRVTSSGTDPRRSPRLASSTVEYRYLTRSDGDTKGSVVRFEADERKVIIALTAADSPMEAALAAQATVPVIEASGSTAALLPPDSAATQEPSFTAPPLPGTATGASPQLGRRSSRGGAEDDAKQSRGSIVLPHINERQSGVPDFRSSLANITRRNSTTRIYPSSPAALSATLAPSLVLPAINSSASSSPSVGLTHDAPLPSPLGIPAAASDASRRSTLPRNTEFVLPPLPAAQAVHSPETQQLLGRDTIEPAASATAPLMAIRPFASSSFS